MSDKTVNLLYKATLVEGSDSVNQVKKQDNEIEVLTVEINTYDGSSYPIIIGEDILGKIDQIIDTSEFGNKATIITDKTVNTLYNSSVLKGLENRFSNLNTIVVQPGESSKSINTAEYIFNKLVELNHRRSDVIIALGGGVIGDLAGFVSSVYLRGVPFIQIPTTLLSQVDSSVGGKVAVNIAGGKNLVGSFYNPKAVIIDIGTLKTLEKDQIKDGLGEVIKYGFIHDGSILENLKEHNIDSIISKDIIDIVYKCILSKQYYVEKDFFDKDIRMILNFGHTIGHAIERQYGYGKITHGQAVAAGMYMISKMLYFGGLINEPVHEKIEYVLERFDMMKEYDLDYQSVIDSIKIDKKSIEEKINIIISEGAGISRIMQIGIQDFIEIIEKYYEGSEIDE